MSLTRHQRMALMNRLGEVGILDHRTRPARGPNQQAETRLHLQGKLDGRPIDVLVQSGGVRLTPAIAGMSMEPAGETTISPEEIEAALRDVLES